MMETRTSKNIDIAESILLLAFVPAEVCSIIVSLMLMLFLRGFTYGAIAIVTTGIATVFLIMYIVDIIFTFMWNKTPIKKTQHRIKALIKFAISISMNLTSLLLLFSSALEWEMVIFFIIVLIIVLLATLYRINKVTLRLKYLIAHDRRYKKGDFEDGTSKEK